MNATHNYRAEDFSTSFPHELNACERSDRDANVAVYTFHLVGILGMAALCIVGNTIVICVMTLECKLNTALNCFIVNLAVSDLLQGVIYAIYNISHLNVPFIRHALGMYSCRSVLIA
jgi:hypothetical protein